MKKTITNILLMLPAAGGIGALIWILADRSEGKNALLFGLSAFRLMLAAMVLALTAASAAAARRPGRLLRAPLYYFAGAEFLISAELLLFSRYPADDSRNLIPLIAGRALPLLLWMLLSAVTLYPALRLSGVSRPKGLDLFLFLIGVLCYWGISSHIRARSWMLILDGNTALCLITMVSAVIWYLTLNSGAERGVRTAAGCFFFMVLGFSVTRLTGMWMGRVNTPSKAYWNELAESFLAGRLDLIAPQGFHDLTLYDGRWYVPNPPMPGILLMPWVALLGSAEAVNMCVYDAVTAGINAGLFFLMLILAFVHKGGPLRRSAIPDDAYPGNSLAVSVWVTVLFVFGTDHLWLGTTGQMWFISQMLVITFTLLACIFVICGFSPVLAGTALGMGVLCRPNIFPVYLCMLGLQLGREREFPRFDLKRTVVWCLKSGIPVVIAVGLLLLYNKMRFDDWMDFGYVTINGADWILESVRQYGMFHPHFLKTNADVMLFGLPRLDFSGERFFFYPYVAGYSIFLMTPPLIYAFRSFGRNWFSAGAWASVLLSVGLLLLYHNTGAEQIGYRYILDVSAPLALMVADGMKGKVSPLFRILTVFAVVLSFIAVYWWYLGRV